VPGSPGKGSGFGTTNVGENRDITQQKNQKSEVGKATDEVDKNGVAGKFVEEKKAARANHLVKQIRPPKWEKIEDQKPSTLYMNGQGKCLFRWGEGGGTAMDKKNQTNNKTNKKKNKKRRKEREHALPERAGLRQGRSKQKRDGYPRLKGNLGQGGGSVLAREECFGNRAEGGDPRCKEKNGEIRRIRHGKGRRSGR